jgi:negative regulator of flagellin synthesis FlgM
VKIDNSSSSLPISSSGGKKGRASATQSGGSTVSSTSNNDTSVNLGATATQLRSMAGSSAGAPINAAKVAEIKQAISEGRFQVNSGAVADSLIKSVSDLLAKR